MKVGYIFRTFPCRSETFSVRELEALLNLGFDITVFAATDGGGRAGCIKPDKIFYRPRWYSKESFLGIFYICFRQPIIIIRLLFLIIHLARGSTREALSLIKDFPTLGHFARCAKRQAISHIHAYFINWPANIALAVSIVTGMDFSISAHAKDVFMKNNSLGLKAKKSKFIRTCNRFALGLLKSKVPPECHHKLRLIYHGLRVAGGCVNPAFKKTRESTDKARIIAVGRLVSKKGFGLLLRAFASVTEQKPDIKLLIVGDGPDGFYLKSLSRKLHLDGRIQFAGWRKPCETIRFIRDSDFLVAPSVVAEDGDRDGIPNVILEAFFCGVPVIASDLGGINEAVKHRRTGLLVEPGDIKGLADAIKELLEDKNLQNTLSHKAYESAIRNFDTVKNVRGFSELFKDSYV